MHNACIHGESEMPLTCIESACIGDARSFNPLVPGSNPGGFTAENTYEFGMNSTS